MDHFEYVAVYQTSLLETHPKKFRSGPIKIEFFEKRVQIPAVDLRQVDIIEESELKIDIAAVQELSDGPYIVISASCPDCDEILGDDLVDRAVAHLSLLFQPALFKRQVYRGWIWKDRLGAFSFDGQRVSRSRISHASLETFDQIEDRLQCDASLLSKYSSMARFFTRSIPYPPSEEKFVLLWIVLEIYPMEDTTNVIEVTRFLSELTGKSIEDVTRHLLTGRLMGWRSDIVHKGLLPIPATERGKVFLLLENICLATIRSAAGLPYDGGLDIYFQPDKPHRIELAVIDAFREK